MSIIYKDLLNELAQEKRVLLLLQEDLEAEVAAKVYAGRIKETRATIASTENKIAELENRIANFIH